jgi:hypothetical protein
MWLKLERMNWFVKMMITRMMMMMMVVVEEVYSCADAGRGPRGTPTCYIRILSGD